MYWRFIKKQISIGLLQEPWINGDRIRGLPERTANVLADYRNGNPRAALLLKKNINFVPIPEFNTRDLAAAVVELPAEVGKRSVVIASAYFPGDEAGVPPEEVQRLINWCRRGNKQLLLSCDANAHHVIWGSTDTNVRGRDLLDYICSNNLDIMNEGNKPTFINAIRQEVLDLTLATPFVSQSIKNWRVMEETSFSDHSSILFDIESAKVEVVKCRVPKKTDWCLYKETLRTELEGLQYEVATTEDLEAASNHLSQCIMASYEASCPLKKRIVSRDVPWWNAELERLKVKARKAFNKAKRNGQWENYTEALTRYNKELRKSKRQSWMRFCEGIDKTAPAARIQKTLSKDHSNTIGLIKRPNGAYTESIGESLNVLLKTHFPGSKVQASTNEMHEVSQNNGNSCSSRDSRRMAGRIISLEKVIWAINSFQPFKSPGKDGIFPALLQKGADLIAPCLTTIFKASYAFGYIPTSWRKVKVVFIPKTGKRPPEEAKSYRPISLSSFVLKSMEKIIDNYIRSEPLKQVPLHINQFAYQPGKATVDALHHLVREVEKSIEAKEIAVGIFIDIEGAFDNTSYKSIKTAATRHGIEPSTINWMESMLESRLITASLGGEETSMTTARGCPQGGVLSPLLWSVVVDDLLRKITDEGYCVLGYADDIVILIKGKHDGVISSRMQSALNKIKEWCVKEELMVNPTKTIIVPFTKRRKLNLKAPQLDGLSIQFSKEVKYLGVTLDAKLTWKPHIDKTISKATGAFWACRKLFGKTWGLKPKMIHWSYISVIRPIVTYASIVWWTKTNEITTQSKLQKLQRLACLGITGAMCTTPTAAMEALLDLPPLHLRIKREGLHTAIRITQSKKLKPGDKTGHLKILNFLQPEMFEKPLDIIPRVFDFQTPFEVVIRDRNMAKSQQIQLEPNSSIWYSDGSKTEQGTGIGIYGPKYRASIALGTYPTIMQAETLAIDLCAQECLRRNTKGKKVYIMSDSQAALKSLKANSFESLSTWECRQSLKKLAMGNKVALVWVPGHEGIEGNEIADELARAGSKAFPIGPEPFCGLSRTHRRAEVQKWEKDNQKSHWYNIPGHRQAKKFIEYSTTKAKKLLLLPKNEIRLITGLFTGHCPVKYHFKKLGLEDSDKCRLCESEVESAEHIICKCDALARFRLKHLGQTLLTPEEVKGKTLRDILCFAAEIEFLRI